VTRATWIVLTITAIAGAIWMHAAVLAQNLDAARELIATQRETIDLCSRGLDRGDTIEALQSEINGKLVRGLAARVNAGQDVGGGL
jgi:hypothetical protein